MRIRARTISETSAPVGSRAIEMFYRIQPVCSRISSLSGSPFESIPTMPLRWTCVCPRALTTCEKLLGRGVHRLGIASFDCHADPHDVVDIISNGERAVPGVNSYAVSWGSPRNASAVMRVESSRADSIYPSAHARTVSLFVRIHPDPVSRPIGVPQINTV